MTPPPPPASGAVATLRRQELERTGLRRPRAGLLADRSYLWLTGVAAVAALLGVGYFFYKAFAQTGDVWSTFGVWDFITGEHWNPFPAHGEAIFGALAFIYGTLVTSAIAMVIAVPIAVGVALATTVFLPRRLRGPIGSLVDLLAAVPSVVFGLWGIVVLVPAAKPVLRWIADHNGGIGFLSGPVTSGSYVLSGLVLAVMVLPIVAAISREVLLTVPRDQQEAAYALGATRWEMVRGAMLPWARSGIVGASALGLGRAVGETIAVYALLGNTPNVGGSLIGPGQTLAAVIANETGEASGLHLSALVALAVVLFVLTFIINAAARLLVSRTASGPGPLRRTAVLARGLRRTANRSAAEAGIVAPTIEEGFAPVSRSRRVRSRLAEGAVLASLALALLPLFLILGYIVVKGAPAFSATFFTKVQPSSPTSLDGGISNALVGTLEMLGLATAVSAPLGILVALFMSDTSSARPSLARAARWLGFVVDMLLGVPSIVVGMIVYVGLVIAMGHYSGFAGAIALAVIMFPIVVRSADEILRLVPSGMKEAALALGAPRWRTTLSVILPAAAPGILTGVMLALARASGETAPLLFTAADNQGFTTNLFDQMASLPNFIFKNAITTRSPQSETLAWGAALLLVLIILLLNLTARFVARRARPSEAR